MNVGGTAASLPPCTPCIRLGECPHDPEAKHSNLTGCMKVNNSKCILAEVEHSICQLLCFARYEPRFYADTVFYQT